MAGADDATTLQGGQYTEQIRSTNAANLIPTFRDGFIHPLIQRRNRASPQEKYGKQFGGGIFNDAAEKGFINILLNRLWVKYPSRNDAPARTRPIFRRTAAQTRQEQPCRRSPAPVLLPSTSCNPVALSWAVLTFLMRRIPDQGRQLLLQFL